MRANSSPSVKLDQQQHMCPPPSHHCPCVRGVRHTLRSRRAKWARSLPYVNGAGALGAPAGCEGPAAPSTVEVVGGPPGAPGVPAAAPATPAVPPPRTVPIGGSEGKAVASAERAADVGATLLLFSAVRMISNVMFFTPDTSVRKRKRTSEAGQGTRPPPAAQRGRARAREWPTVTVSAS